MNPPTAIVIEDNIHSRTAVAALLEQVGYQTYKAGTVAGARECLQTRKIDLAVLDLELPDGSGMDLLEPLQAGKTEVVVLTGHGKIDTAVEAMRLGVMDFMTKPLDINRFEKIIRDAKRNLQLQAESTKLREELSNKGKLAGMIGKSQRIRETFRLIEKAAPTNTTVMITGETGTGKEVAANAIHKLSRRSDKRFVSVNCGAIQPSLIESELFGHEAGAFTGASKQRKGLFELAHGGTLFLDEIFEMPLDLQVKLLRVLETREVKRLGADKTQPVDFRLIGASNKNPHEAVEAGTLREDLMYRLMIFPVELPPLRERKEDIPLLATHFLDLLSSLYGEQKHFTASAFGFLESQEWPGNVRELRNTVERGFIISEDSIEPEHLVAQNPLQRKSGEGLKISVGMTVAEAERVLLEATLKAFEGDKRQAAEVLGVSLKTLYNRLKTFEVPN